MTDLDCVVDGFDCEYMLVIWMTWLWLFDSNMGMTFCIHDMLHGLGFCTEEAFWWLCHKYLFWWLCHNICIWWLCHNICSGSHAANSVVCSGWVGRVVSPHGVRLVRGCIRLDWVGIAFTFWFWFCYLILILILILSPDSDSNSDSSSDNVSYSVMG